MLTLAATFDGRRTIPGPEISRIMLDLLQLTPKDKLLEIGTGSGTQTRLFALTGAEVHSVELEPWLSAVDNDGCTNLYLHEGNGLDGIAHEAPFTAIVATCGVNDIPATWTRQLGESGRLVAPVGDAAAQRLTLFTKSSDELIPLRIAAYCRFQMLKDKPPPGKIPYQAKHAVD